MSKKTIYGCDRCGHESENEKNFYEITIRAPFSRIPHERLVCKACAGGLVESLPVDATPRAATDGETP